MEIQSQDPLCRIADLITTMIRQSSCDERNELGEALKLFTQCTSSYASLDPETTREIEEQIEWIHLYRSYQDRYPTYRRTLGDSLLPVTEDTEDLMLRFAHEVLDGAQAISNMLQIKPPESWTRVGKLRRGRQEDEGVEMDRDPEYDSAQSDTQDSDGESHIDTGVVVYSDPYF